MQRIFPTAFSLHATHYLLNVSYLKHITPSKIYYSNLTIIKTDDKHSAIYTPELSL